MTDLSQNFLKEYSKALSDQKERVNKALKAWELEDKKLFSIQRLYLNTYKKKLAFKYLTLWDKSNKFPKDPELYDAVMYIASGEYDSDGLAPKTEISYDNIDCKFTLKYYNKRLSQWMEIKNI